MPRVSKFNIYLPLKANNGKHLIIQGLWGAFDVVDSGIVEILQNSEKDESNLKFLASTNLEALLKRGYITKLSEDKEFSSAVKIINALNLHRQKNISLTVAPTYNCNLRCTYCFESNLHKLGEDFLSAQMDTRLIDAIFKQMQKYKESGYKINAVGLFGGEPLLDGNQKIITYLCDKITELGVGIYCTSNGYDLDAFIHIAKKYDFNNIQVTVDGTENIHDSRRFLNDGGGTFAKIMDNIELALRVGIPIVARTNINAENVEEIKSLLNIYENRGWTNKANFKYYFKSTMGCYESPDNAVDDVNLMKALSAIHRGTERFRLGGGSYNILAAKLKKLFEDGENIPIKSSYCAASTGMYVADPFGDIYPCLEVLGDTACSIGSVDVERGLFVFNDRFKDWRSRTVNMVEDCRECKYMLFCGGGCPAEGKVVSGSYFKAHCDNFQTIFNEVATEMCEEHLS